MHDVPVCVCCFFKLIFSQLFFIILTFALVINIWIFAKVCGIKLLTRIHIILPYSFFSLVLQYFFTFCRLDLPNTLKFLTPFFHCWYTRLSTSMISIKLAEFISTVLIFARNLLKEKRNFIF
jgi:hypothetical protein